MSALKPDKLSNGDTHHRAEALAADLPPLLVAAERVASTVSQGVHGRRRVGQGETFWQFRRYEFGDSVQQIDWRRSARSDPLYIRETEWEAAQSVWLWRDGSPSMDFRSRSDLETKRQRADLLLLALASLLVRGGERTALLETDMIPASGRAVMHQLWTAMESGRTPSGSLPGLELLPRFARVVMIGDFLSSFDEIEATVDAYAGQGIRGHLIQVLDPAEEQLPYDGRVLFEGPEAEGEVLIPHVASLRDAYQGELARHRDDLRALASRAGWSFAFHHTDHAAEGPLMALYLQLSETITAGTGRG
jgi:uncharacterized protein (DUF58 family)